MAANATVFGFSYEFAGGPSVSGTLGGTASGDFVTGISNVNFSIDSSAFGPASVHSYWVVAGTQGGPTR